MANRILTGNYINVDAKDDGSLLLVFNVDGYRGCELTDPNKPISEGVYSLVDSMAKLAARFRDYEDFHLRNGRKEQAEAFGKAAHIATFEFPLSDVVTLKMIERYGREHAYDALNNVPAWKVASAFFMD